MLQSLGKDFLCNHEWQNTCSCFICIHFSFMTLVEGLCCKLKYRANIIHHFIFVFSLYFFYHSSCRKDHFTVLSFKFGTQDFTDPGLLKIRRTHTGLLLWFCLHKCFWYPGVIPFVSYIDACVPQVVWFFSRFVHENGSAHYSLKRVPFSMKPQEYINVFLPKNLRINLGFWETAHLPFP